MAVVVFGSINVDHCAYVERHPRIGETLTGFYSKFPGGKGANQAIAASRAGSEVIMLGATGDDAEGEYMADFLNSEKVMTDNISVVEKPTGVAIIMIDSESNNSIAVCPGANMEACFLQDSTYQIGSSDICLAQGEVSIKEVEKFFIAAKNECAVTIFNPAPYAGINQEMLATVDYLILNEIEFAQHIGVESTPTGFEEVASLLENRDLKNTIVTLGSLGAIARLEKAITIFEAPDVEAIDTVGAGDCFCGYLAARLEAGDELIPSIKWATKAASLSVTKKGAASSMPSWKEVASE